MIPELAVPPTAALPQTLLARRSRTAWPIAMGCAVLANLAVIGLLAALSRGARPEPAELAVPPVTLRPVPPEPVAVPTPAPTNAPPESPATVVPALPVALPALADLVPVPASPTALSLEPIRDQLPTLAVGLPAFAAADPGSAVAADPGPTPLAEQPARLPPGVESLLERHFPFAARQRGITGETRVIAAIAADGTVTDVTVLTSTPPGVFEAAARKALGRLCCQPAISGGRAVASSLPVTLAWTLRNP